MIVNPGRMYSDTCSVTNSKSTPFILELNIKKYLACELIKKNNVAAGNYICNVQDLIFM